MTSNTDISLKNFFIYNLAFGQREGHEEEKVMYFYPRGTNVDVQMKEVGLSEAIVKFAETFSDESCETLQTLKTKKYFFKPEEDFWIIMTVNLPTCLVGKERLDGVDYLPNDVQNSIYLAVLRQAYLAAKLFLGPFQRLIEKDNGSPDLLKKKLDSFYTKYLLSLDLKKCDIIDLFQGVQFLPLDKPTFLHSQCFLNLFETAFPQVDYSLLLFNEQLVWSGLPAEDAQVVYRYLVTSLLPYFLSHSGSSDGRRTATKPNRFVTGPENLTDLDVTYSGKVPRVYLSHIPQPGFYHLIVYRYHQSTLSVLVQGNEPVKLDFYRRMDSFLFRRLDKVNGELSEYKEQQPNSSPASDFDQDSRFVYFNSMNLATKTTLDKKKDGSGQSASKELLKLLVEIYQHQKWLGESGCLSSETIMKTMTEYWVIGKMSNNRQFYVTVERKKTNLVEVSEEVRKMCDKQLKNIFFHV